MVMGYGVKLAKVILSHLGGLGSDQLKLFTYHMWAIAYMGILVGQNPGPYNRSSVYRTLRLRQAHNHLMYQDKASLH